MTAVARYSRTVRHTCRRFEDLGVQGLGLQLAARGYLGSQGTYGGKVMRRPGYEAKLNLLRTPHSLVSSGALRAQIPTPLSPRQHRWQPSRFTLNNVFRMSNVFIFMLIIELNRGMNQLFPFEFSHVSLKGIGRKGTRRAWVAVRT